MNVENGTLPDYIQLFHDKLAAIDQLSQSDSVDHARRYVDLGISEVKRLAWTIVFITPTSPSENPSVGDYRYDVWTTNPKNVFPSRAHFELKKDLDEFRTNTGVYVSQTLGDFTYNGYVIQDENDNLYMFIPPYSENENKEQPLLGEYKNDKRLRSLVERYGITLVASFYLDEDHPHLGTKHIKLLDRDFVGQLREETYLRQYTTKFGLTNSQFMRFRLTVLAAREAQQSMDYTPVAEGIVNQEGSI